MRVLRTESCNNKVVDNRSLMKFHPFFLSYILPNISLSIYIFNTSSSPKIFCNLFIRIRSRVYRGLTRNLAPTLAGCLILLHSAMQVLGESYIELLLVVGPREVAESSLLSFLILSVRSFLFAITLGIVVDSLTKRRIERREGRVI
jgi:hypothetical protein